MSGSEGRLSGLALDPEVVASLEAVLPRMAERTVAAIIAEVPAYADPFSGRMGPNIENAVQNALGAFLRLAIRAENTDSAPSLSPALDGAYELGRGEARNGRSIDVLLSAYRVGARVAWRELSSTAVSAGLEAKTVARFAELVFAFIDELSASSVSGHADELATAGRVRQRYLDALTGQLLAGEPAEVLAGQCGARELACPADAYRGAAARRPQPRTGSPVRRRSPAGHRGPARPGSGGVVVGDARPRHGRWATAAAALDAGGP